MCGINGIISKDKNKDKLIKSMNEKILHRGPDAEGIFVEGDVALLQFSNPIFLPDAPELLLPRQQRNG